MTARFYNKMKASPEAGLFYKYTYTSLAIPFQYLSGLENAKLFYAY
jgi:hypothetical protein